MISEITARPKPSNNRARNVFIISLVIAAIVAVVSCFIPHYKGVVGILSIVFIVVAIYVYQKYLGAGYCYDVVITDEGKPLFVVRQIIGKRQTTLFSTDLYGIVAVKRETAENRRNNNAGRDVASYFFCPTMSPEVTYRLCVRTRHTKCDVVIEANDEFASLLASFAAEAYSLHQTESCE